MSTENEWNGPLYDHDICTPGETLVAERLTVHHNDDGSGVVFLAIDNDCPVMLGGVPAGLLSGACQRIAMAIAQIVDEGIKRQCKNMSAVPEIPLPGLYPVIGEDLRRFLTTWNQTYPSGVSEIVLANRPICINTINAPDAMGTAVPTAVPTAECDHHQV